MTESTEMTELKNRLERLAQRGNDPGPEWLIASVRGRIQLDSDEAIGAPRRRALVSVVIAFVAVVVIAVVAVVVRSHDRASAPPVSTPHPTVPAPTGIATESISAFDRQPALVSPSEGWVCDQPLRHTTDSGRTWQSIALADYPVICEFLPGGRAWVGTNGDLINRPPTVVRIVAGQQPHVTPVELPGATPQETLASLTFTNDDRGWALTSLQLDQAHHYRNRNDLYATVDGGLHWHIIATDAPIAGGLEFTSATRGWAVDAGQLQRTDNGGRTWTSVAVTLPPTISDAPTLKSVFVFGDRIVVEGVRPDAKSPIKGTNISVATVGDVFDGVSNDNGRTWSSRIINALPSVLLGVLPTFVAVDASHWRLFGYPVYVTNDAGHSWQNSGNALFNATGTGSLGGMSFITPELGWVTMCKYAPATPGALPIRPGGPPSSAKPLPCNPLVVRTADGGRTWTRVAQL
jgi:hypothetical protein